MLIRFIKWSLISLVTNAFQRRYNLSLKTSEDFRQSVFREISFVVRVITLVSYYISDWSPHSQMFEFNLYLPTYTFVFSPCSQIVYLGFICKHILLYWGRIQKCLYLDCICLHTLLYWVPFRKCLYLSCLPAYSFVVSTYSQMFILCLHVPDFSSVWVCIYNFHISDACWWSST